MFPTKVIASASMLLYHLQTMKQKLWTTLVTYLAYCINKQRQEGSMRCKMNKFTLLDGPYLVIRSEVFVNVRRLVMNLGRSCLLKTGVRAKVRANDVRLVYGWSTVGLRSSS